MKLCKICTLPAKMRATIDRALVEGTTYKAIAARFSTSTRPINQVNLCRHRRHVLPKELIRRAPTSPPEIAVPLLQRVESLYSQSVAIAHAAQAKGEWTAATSGLREARCSVELMGKLTGELGSSSNTNFNLVDMREEQVLAFLNAIAKRAGAPAARTRKLIEDIFGLQPPVINIRFGDPRKELPMVEDTARSNENVPDQR